MRHLSLIVLLLISGSAFSQIQKKYYTWQWKETDPSHARFGSVIRQTDSGWLRHDIFLTIQKPQMAGLYSDSTTKVRNGWFTYYYSNGAVSSTGKMVNNKRDGLWLSYYQNGNLKDSATYKNERLTGIYIYRHPGGSVMDSTILAPDGTGKCKRWFDNGNISETGNFASTGKKDGEWKYYFKAGTLAAQEQFENGKMISAVYFDERSNIIKDTADKINISSHYGTKTDDWKKYLLKNLSFPDGVRLKNTDEITVVVSAMIDEEGNLYDIFLDIPFDPAFDKKAIEVMKKAPSWKPQIKHGRPMASGIRQPLTFAQFEQ